MGATIEYDRFRKPNSKVRMALAGGVMLLLFGFAAWLSPAARGQAQRPATTAPSAATAPGVAPASQPRARSQDDLFDQLALTPEQRAAIQTLIDEADKATRTWWSAHKDPLHKLYDQRQAADKANDNEKFQMLGLQTTALMRLADCPQPQQLVGQITVQLTIAQREKFTALHGAEVIDPARHQIIMDAAQDHACMLCHVPLKMQYGTRGRRPHMSTMESSAARKVVDQFIADLKLSAEEQATIAPVQQQAHADARAWWEARREAIAKLEGQVAAATQPDGLEAEPARLQFEELVKDAPRPLDELKAIRAALSPQRQDDYKTLMGQAHGNNANRGNCHSCHMAL